MQSCLWRFVPDVWSIDENGRLDQVVVSCSLRWLQRQFGAACDINLAPMHVPPLAAGGNFTKRHRVCFSKPALAAAPYDRRPQLACEDIERHKENLLVFERASMYDGEEIDDADQVQAGKGTNWPGFTRHDDDPVGRHPLLGNRVGFLETLQVRRLNTVREPKC